MNNDIDTEFMRMAIRLSRRSVDEGGFPIGALVVFNNEVISEGVSNGKQLNDPTSHAETAAIREACKQFKTNRIKGATLYSSMEPCVMCYAAAYWAGISRIVYACSRKKIPGEYFEGSIDLHQLNEASRRKMEIVHREDLEEESALVLRLWRPIRQGTNPLGEKK